MYVKFERDVERKILRGKVKRKASEDISARSSKVIRTELRSMGGNNLQSAVTLRKILVILCEL